ncbi:MAG: glycosyltransferase [Methanoregula sp.]|nr:glycosyltransferase [Methanoregula sp.]
MPLVSVVIPTYNRLAILNNTLESVFSQSFSDFEVIVIDDGSTESFDPLVKQYEDRVTFIRLPHSGLPSIARNCGMKKAKGQYVAFLDSDDLWLKEKLKIQVQVFSDHPEIALVCSDAYILKPGSEEKMDKSYLNDRNAKTGFLLDDLINNNFIITSTCTVRLDVLHKIGGFSEDPVFRGIEDYELWLRIARQYQMQYLPIPLAVYRDAENSLRSEISLMRYHEGMERIYTDLQNEFPVAEQFRVTNKQLVGKIYDNKLAKLCLFLSMGDKVHFKTLLKSLIVMHPLLVPKLFARITKTYFRRMINMKKRKEFECF